MFKPLVIAILTVSAIAGCSKFEVLDKTSGNETGTGKLELGKFQYEFNSRDQAGLPCTSGLQTLKSSHQVCMRLQDHSANNSCAFKERLKKFEAECGPKGYSFHESRECRIFVGSWVNLIPGTYDIKKSVLWKRFCVGRSFEDNIINESIAELVKIDALPGYSVNVVMSLGNQSSAPFSVPSSAQISIIKTETGEIVGIPVHAISTARTFKYENFDGGAQIQIACNPVSYCE